MKDVLYTLYVGMLISARHAILFFTPYFKHTILQGRREGMD